MIEFQALCEGLGNFELRSPSMAILPPGAEEEAWRRAFTTLLRGFVPDGAADRCRRPRRK